MANICMVAYTYYERDPRVRREAEALVEIGHSVEIIALRDSGRSTWESCHGIDVLHLPLTRQRGGVFEYVINYGLFFTLALICVSILHLRRKYDLIHVHNMPDFLIFTAVLPKMTGTPILLDVHDPMPELFSAIFKGRINTLFKKILLLQEQLSHRFADQLITVHEGMRQLLLQRGVRDDRLEIIHNLPDPAVFSISRRETQKFTLVYVGTISPRHRLDLLVEAVSMEKQEVPDLLVRIAGDGPDVPRLKELARSYGVIDNIKFEGIVPIESVPFILAESNAAIASYANDNFGRLVFPTKAVEALMVGVPVICARVPAVERYFDDRTLFFFEPEDVGSLVEQIRLVRSNQALVEERVRNGSEILLSLNWVDEKKKLIKIINRLIGE